MTTEEIHQLIVKYNNNTASLSERIVVEQWLDGIEGENDVPSDIDLAELKHEIYAEIEKNVENKPTAKIKLRKPFQGLLWAAVFAGLLFSGVFLYQGLNKSGAGSGFVAEKTKQILPGGNNALLQLGDGSTIILNEVATGNLTTEAGVKITKSKDGELIYTSTEINSGEVKNNTITTPLGGQYHVILTDGTQVWLNAGSSLSFPSAFTGSSRRVNITGEAYFEVAKNKKKPFIVNTGLSEIKVLGTHFNVNAYADEGFQKATLIEGSIEIQQGKYSRLLTPGDQASVSKSLNPIKVTQIEDLDGVIAWKEGYFQFTGSDLSSLMRQISRWYDTEVVYEGSMPSKEYIGKIPRNVKVEKLIEMLAYSGINCRVENHKIILNSK